MNGYKVCKKTKQGTYTSASDFGRILLYSIGETTSRPFRCGPLAVFTNEKDARSFIDTGYFVKCDDYALFECEYQKSDDTFLWVYSEVYESNCEFWSVPKGTNFADEVTLIREIPW